MPKNLFLKENHAYAEFKALPNLSPYLNGILFNTFSKNDSARKEIKDKFHDASEKNKKYSTCFNCNEVEAFDHNTEDSKFVKLEKNHTNLLYDGYFCNKSALRKKYKRRKNAITICTANSKFEVIRRVSAAFGLKEVDENDTWDILWTDLNIPASRAKEMRRFQRINHFPGMFELSRKDLLAKNLTRMQKCFPKDYDFFPKTWCLPSDFSDTLHFSKKHKNSIFIVKPECGSQGKGIFLTKNLKDVEHAEKLVCQLYITKPYLIDGFKFDIRIYTLISSIDPLRIYVYNEGLVRFATIRYADPNVFNSANIFMHLTNYAVNKLNSKHLYYNDSGIKRKLSTLNDQLTLKGIDVDHLWKRVDQAIVKTIISAWPVLKHNYHHCFPSHDMIQACFEILGFDILLDQDANPYILEVNQSPSFNTDSFVDRDVKDSLIADTLTLLNIWQCDKKKIIEEDKRRVAERLIYGNQKQSNNGRLSPIEKENVKEKEKLLFNDQVKWENEHLGNFRCVYPKHQFEKFFDQPSHTLFLSTMSSRAREECVKQQREEFEAKTKFKQITKFPSMGYREQTYGEHSNKLKLVKKDKVALPNIVKKENSHESFEPVPIIEAEERKRLTELAYRMAHIESKGLSQKIYCMMKDAGTLGVEDEKKIANRKWFKELKQIDVNKIINT